MRRLFHSVNTRLTFTVALIVLFYTVLLLLLTYGFMRDIAERSSAELADTVLEETDTHITRFFRNMEELARSFAEYPPVYEVDIPRLRELILANVRARRGYLRAMYLGTEDGEMYEWGYGEGFVKNEPVLPPGYDPRVRPWYRTAVEADDFAVTPPYLYASIDAYGITCVLPVRDRTDRRVGVLGLDIMIDALQALVADFEISMGGKVLMVDRAGVPLVNQFSGYEAGDLPAFVAERSAEPSDGPPEGKFVASVIGSPGMEEIPHFFSYKQNPVTGWTVYVGLPLPEIMASTYNGIRLSVALILLLMTLLLITLEWSSRKMVIDPVEHMVSTVARLGAGESGVRFQLNRDDEYNTLARSFNGLLDRLEEYSQEMERKVAERTSRLQVLQQENVRLRIIEEKERIYGYLHDSLDARLTNIVISNNVAGTALDSDRDVQIEMHNRIGENAQAGLNDLKEILAGSAESERAIIDFDAVLELQVRRRLDLKEISLSFEGDTDELNLLPRPTAIELEKLLQELVSNVLKHSEARSVTMRTVVDSEIVQLDVRDDGRGFDPTENVGDCFGLANIRSRLMRLGGSIEINSVTMASGRDDHGTAVRIILPLEGQIDAAD
jgi:methyl-accepting chemotaxis protein